MLGVGSVVLAVASAFGGVGAVPQFQNVPCCRTHLFWLELLCTADAQQRWGLELCGGGGGQWFGVARAHAQGHGVGTPWPWTMEGHVVALHDPGPGRGIAPFPHSAGKLLVGHPSASPGLWGKGGV